MRLLAETRKWTATIRIAWLKLLAYKFNFTLQVLGPVLVFFFIRYNLWAAIYQLKGITTLQGYTFPQMLAYQAWVMLVSFLGLGFNGMSLAEDIRLGRISAYLVYPFGFWPFHASSFLATQLLQLLIGAITVAALTLVGWIAPHPGPLLRGTFYCCVMALFWFQINFLIGILAFWLEETWVLRVMCVLVTQFFSGAMIPLELFPDWLRASLDYLPFPYLVWVPVKLFMGSYSGSLLQAFGILLLWTALALLASALVWRQGIRAYTGAGI
jgi:ABC-2 type transport system permease protein